MQAQFFEEFFPKAKATQIKDALKVAITTQLLPLKRKPAPIVWGAPGVGKTSVIEAVAGELGMRCVTIITAVYEATDIGGFPSPKEEYVDYKPPKQLYNIISSDKPVVIFLDEIDKAATSVQNAVLRLILNRELNGMTLPNYITFALAANPPGQGGEWMLTPPLSNRLVHFYLGCDPESVAAWFESEVDIEDEVGDGRDVSEMVDMGVFRQRLSFYRKMIAAFLRKSPQFTLKVPDSPLLQSLPFPSPRSWEFVSILLATADAVGLRDEGVKRLLVWGCVGDTADCFMSFLAENSIPEPKEIIENPGILLTLPPDKIHHAIIALTEYAHQSKDNFRKVASLIPVVDSEMGSDISLQLARGLKRVVEKSKDDELRDMLIDVIGRTRLVEIWSASR